MRFDTSIEGKPVLTELTVEEGTALYTFLSAEFIPYHDELIPLHALIQRVGGLLEKRKSQEAQCETGS